MADLKVKLLKLNIYVIHISHHKKEYFITHLFVCRLLMMSRVKQCIKNICHCLESLDQEEPDRMVFKLGIRLKKILQYFISSDAIMNLC